MNIKIVNEHVKINSRTQVDSVETLNQLVVANNQVASFQILMDTKRKCIVSISDEMSLTHDIDATRLRVKVLSEFSVTLHHEIMLKDSDGMEYADILSHKPYVVAEANKVHAIWVDTQITPSRRRSDDVIVEVYMTNSLNDEILVFKDSVNLEVLNVSIPDPNQYKIYLDLWQHNSGIARFFEVPLWSDLHFQKIENVVKELSKIGQKSVMLIASETPWNGWGSHIMSKDDTSLYEHSIIRLVRTQEGILKADFSAMQRYIDLCSKYGIDKDYSLYGLLGVWNLPLYPSVNIKDYPEAILVRYLDEESGCYKFIDDRADIIEYLKLIVSYFKSTNQLAKLRIAADEPKKDKDKLEQYSESISILKSIEPSIQFKIAFDKDQVFEKYREIVADVCTSFPCTCKYYNDVDVSKRKLWYICNIPDKPNTFLKSSMVDSRILGPLTYVFKYDGLLRWSFTCWTKNPCQSIQYATQGFPVGDLNLVYPEMNGGIALSLRYKALQRGIEDYEIIMRLIEYGKEDVVSDALEMIGLNLDPSDYMIGKRKTADDIYSQDYNNFEKMRRILLKGLEQ